MRTFGVFFAVVLSVIALCVGFAEVTNKPPKKCIAVFYDNKSVLLSMAQILQIYPDFEQVSRSVDSYQSGELERCQVSFIISTEYDHQLPRKLMDDFVGTQRNVVWIGYNIWQLGEQLEKQMGLRYIRAVAKKIKEPCDLFYGGKVLAYSEQGLPLHLEFLPISDAPIEILAEIRSKGTRELTPFFVRSENRFYIADVRFSDVMPREFLNEIIKMHPVLSQNN